MGIPFSALVSIIFGMMIFSFPIGAFVVFNSNIEDEIRFDYPINGFDFFPEELVLKFQSSLKLGDVFIVLWSVFVILFSIAMLGPKTNFLKTLSPIIQRKI